MTFDNRQRSRRAKLWWGVVLAVVIVGTMPFGCWPAGAQHVAPPTQEVRLILPIDLVELIKAVFFGIASICFPLATIYSVVAANRAKRAELQSTANSTSITKVNDNVALIERNTNSMTSEIARLSREKGATEGERVGVLAGEKKAQELAEGQRQGRDHERASGGQSYHAPPQAPPHVPHRSVVEPPLPVADARTADAAERSAAATERVADAAEEATAAAKKT